MRKIFSIVAAILLVASVGFAQTRTLEWDPPTALEDGSPIPAGETLLYKVFAGDTVGTLTERAQVNTPSVLLSNLGLTPTDQWVAVETYSVERVGIRSVAVQVVPVLPAITIRIIQTLGP